MLAKAMRLRSAGYGAKVTVSDWLKGAGVIIGGTLLTVLLSSWMRQQSFDKSYSSTLMDNGWLIFFVVSMRYTTLKGWPGRTQAVFMGLVITVIAALAWVNAG